MTRIYSIRFEVLNVREIKIKRDDIHKTYFLDRCGGGPKPKDFQFTIKPFSFASEIFIIELNRNYSERL